MKCQHCGFESEQAFSFCPGCGASQQETAIVQNNAAASILTALKDKLFLVICILTSVSAGCGILSLGIPVFETLFTIFLWLIYAKTRNNTVDVKNLRCVSGTVFAVYVCEFVVAGLVAFLGIIFGLLFGTLGACGLMEEIYHEISGEIFGNPGAIMSMVGTIFMVVFIVAAAIVVVLNFFSYRYFHQFAKSLYKSAESGTMDLKRVNAVFVWLIVFAACTGISTLGLLSTGALSALASGSSCAIFIVSAIWIKKYFKTTQQVVEA